MHPLHLIWREIAYRKINFALGALAVTGVFDLAKQAGGGVTFAIGNKVYWDDTNNVAVATDGAGANKLLGKAVLAAANGDTTVRARLSQ